MSAGQGRDDLTPSLTDEPAESLVAVEDRERHFGRYLLRYEIASGGMATVYLARARGPGGFDRPLALKRIHPHLAKKREFVEMFLDEARLLARITHPNVCSVFDFGEVEGTYYIAMEYLVGQPLVGVLRALEKRPEIASSPRWHALAARIIADAAEGLHAAHELRDESGQPLGVVHRDVSPHNVFVTYDGAVKVVDFGIAWAEGRLHHTQTGSLKGKLAYMAPEQVRGAKLDRRVDVWALGVCLWELLAVRRLFGKRTEVELMQGVMKDPLLPASVVRPGVPLVLDDIALRALERDLDVRFPSARAMGRELNAYVSESGVPAGLADLAELMEDLFPRERAATLGIVATVLGTGSTSLPGSSDRSSTRATAINSTARDATATVSAPQPTMTVAAIAPPEPEPRHTPLPSDLPPIPAPSRGGPWLAVLIVLALAAVIGAGIFLQHRARMQRVPA
ncbi:MAG: protein kinase, partial [Myxococcota bacterium]|nr:protein kinase [Myxococcota bacterium]